MNKWTKSHLRFCIQEESKQSKNNEKRGQQDLKSRLTLGPITFGTKWNRDTDVFFCRKMGSMVQS